MLRVARLKFDADEVCRLASGAVLVGVAALLQLGEGRTGRGQLGDLELEQVDMAGGAHRHVQAPVAGRLLTAMS